MQSTVANNSLLKDAKLTIDGAQLGIKAGKTLDLVGNNIIINNARLSDTSQLPENQTASPQALQNAIEIRLVAKKNNADVSLIRAANGYLPLPVQNPNADAGSGITITNSTLDVSGNGGGRIGVWGKDIAINGNSSLIASNKGDTPSAAAGGVQIWGNSISLANSNVVVNAESQGSAGNLKVIAEQNLMINNNAILQLSDNEKTAPVTGQDRGITLKAGNNLTLESGSNVNLFSNSSQDDSNLTMEVGGDIKLYNFASINIVSNNIKEDSLLIVADKNLSISKGSNITASSSGLGNVAPMTIKASGAITLKKGSSIFTETGGSGSAGNVNITGGYIVIDGDATGDYGSAHISTGTGSLGSAGNIQLRSSGDFIIRNGGLIASNTDGQHQGGNIDIKAKNISLEGNISSSSAHVGDGGNIALRANDLVILRNANISTRVTGSSGSGGNINITGKTLLLQSTSITADTFAKAHGGNIDFRLTNIVSDYMVVGGNTLAEQNDTKGFSLISVAAPNGISGLISFTSPQLNLSGVLMGFGGSQFLATGLDSNACVSKDGSSLSSTGLAVIGVGLVDNE